MTYVLLYNLDVVKQVKHLRVNLFEVIKNILKLTMLILDKVTIQETGAFVKYVVISSLIELNF